MKLWNLKSKCKQLKYLLFLAIFTLGCSSSDDAVISSAAAPVTSFSLGSGCTDATTYYSCTGTSTFLTLTTSETTATIFYASVSGSEPTSTDFTEKTGTASIEITGTVGTNQYVSVYSVGASGSQETAQSFFISFTGATTTTTTTTTTTPTADTTAPVSSIAVSGTGVTCTTDSTTSDCDGVVTLTISANETATVFYTSAVAAAPATPTTSSTSSAAALSLAVSASDYRISYFVQDAAGNQEATKSFTVNISAITPSVNSGYYKDTQSFTLGMSSTREISKFQMFYLKNTDPTATLGTLMDATPAANASATRYLDYYGNSGCDDSYKEPIGLNAVFGTTSIHEFSYSAMNGGTYVPASCSVTGGQVDATQSLVIYIDADTPRVNLVPAGGGSMDTTMTVNVNVHDPGFQTITSADSTNSALSTATPIQNASATYCTPTTNTTDPASSGFWSSCIESWIGIADNQTFDATTDIYYSIKSQDAAENVSACLGSSQANCSRTPAGGDGDAMVYQFTPGKMETSYYSSDTFSDNLSDHYHYGHSIAVGDLDGDGYDNDYAVGVPSLMADSTTGDLNNGAVFVYYNGFRERATKSFSLSATTVDLTGYSMTLSADGNSLYTINFSGTGTPATGEYNALSTDIDTITTATAPEIARVLNRAFLESLGTSYALELYAEATTDTDGNGVVSVSHNKQSQTPYFTIVASATLGTFTTTTQTVRPYDYVYYGEANGDEFGFSVEIAAVDTTTATSSKSLIVGAPGESSNIGAAYILALPASATTAASGQVSLATSLATTGYKITGDPASTGRFGHAITTYSVGSTANPDLFVSAPFLDGAGTKRGAIYQFTTADFTYGATAVASTDAVDAYVGGSAADNGLMGFSMVIGKALDSKSYPYIYAGAPGIGVEGKVYTLPLDITTPASIETASASTASSLKAPFVDGSTLSNNRYGYSVAISDGNFDTNPTAATCPCLVVGAPGTSGGTYNAMSLATGSGAVWVNNLFLFSGSAEQAIGAKVFLGKLGNAEYKQTLFVGGIGTNATDHSGAAYVIRPQVLASSSQLASSNSITGPIAGGNFGASLAVVQYNEDADANGDKALLIGAPGEVWGGTDTYYTEGSTITRSRSQRGIVHIYSATRLGY